MARELLNVNETNTIKEGDDSTTIILSAHDNNEPAVFKAGDIGTIKISTEDVQVPSIPAKLIIGSNNVNINSKDLATLPAGQYQLELWVSQKDGPEHTIYPSDGTLSLTIDKSTHDLTGKKLTTLTLDDLRQDLHKDIEDAVKQIKVDPSGLDLSGYAKKSDLPKVPEIKLDTIKRTLNIDGQEISIPEAVDLSGYAKTSDVPDVKYNAETKTLTVNGSVVQIPANIDLSNYYTKEQVNEQIKSANPTIDLSDYVTHEDLTDYAKKSDIPATPDLTAYAKKSDIPAITINTQARTLTLNGQSINIPNTVDLSGYATKADLPHITLDVAKREITVGDATLDVPGNVDLSGYYTKSEVDSKLASAAAGGKVDLSGYVKVEDLKNYALKSEIPTAPDLSGYALKSDIKSVDLTPYLKIADANQEFAKKGEVPSVVYDAEKKTLSVNGVTVKIPENVDLTDYVKKEDTESFAKKSDIPNVPSIKLDMTKRTLDVDGQEIVIPGEVDLTGYVKSSDLDTYAKKSDLPRVPNISLDTTKRTLTIDGNAISIPENVDLSEYAKKNEVPDVKYDANSKTLTIDGQVVKIPSSVDLSNYYNKSEVDKKISDSKQTVDLTSYLTKTDADAKYALKSQVGKTKAWEYTGSNIGNIENGPSLSTLTDFEGNEANKTTNPVHIGDIIFTTWGEVYVVDNAYGDYYVQSDPIKTLANATVGFPDIDDVLKSDGSVKYQIDFAYLNSHNEFVELLTSGSYTKQSLRNGHYNLANSDCCGIFTSSNSDAFQRSLVYPQLDKDGTIQYKTVYTLSKGSQDAKIPDTVKPLTLILDDTKCILYIMMPYSKYVSGTEKKSLLRITILKDYADKLPQQGMYIENLSDPGDAENSNSSSTQTQNGNDPLPIDLTKINTGLPLNLPVIPSTLLVNALGAKNGVVINPDASAWKTVDGTQSGKLMPAIYDLSMEHVMSDKKKAIITKAGDAVSDVLQFIDTGTLKVIVTKSGVWAAIDDSELPHFNYSDIDESKHLDWKQIM